jgi:hypothetical protein
MYLSIAMVILTSCIGAYRVLTSLDPKVEEEKQANTQLDTLMTLYKTVEKPIAYHEEKPLEIKKLYVYPIRGIRTSPVESIELGPYGVKYDREIVLIDAETMKPCTT